jgi:uncharacterized protein (DUF305 family)
MQRQTRTQVGIMRLIDMAVMAGAAVPLGIVMASCNRESPPSDAAPSAVIVQPGAPGEASRVLTAATVGTPVPPDRPANREFIQGMILHHAQALEMVKLLETRTDDPGMRLLAKKIEISQTQEIQAMQAWLARHGQTGPQPMPDGTMQLVRTPMPGMLTAQQMAALADARALAFDRLFLLDMIQHHTGALAMVKQLFDTPGAGQDSELFAFTSDVDSDQRTDIVRMLQMLKRMQ